MAIVNGTSGNDNLLGKSSNDTLNGFGGNDTLDGGNGVNTLIGGTGSDTYIVDSTTDTIIEHSGGGAHDLVKSSVDYTLGSYLNDLTLTGNSAIGGTGNSLDNTIIGNNTDNYLSGGDQIDENTGSDFIYGLGGNDELYGLDGNDLLNGGDGNDYLLGLGGSDTLYGEAGNDFLLDNSSGFTNPNDLLYGGAGNDFLDGSDGNNQLYGEAGNDTLISREGDEILDGGSGFDLVDYSYFQSSKEGVVVNLATGTASGLNGNDKLFSIEAVRGGVGNDTLIGNASSNILYAVAPGIFFDAPDLGDDSLDGGAGNDTLYGYGGSDTLDGGTGADTLIGGADSDTYVVNGTTDTIVEYSGGGSHDLIKSSVSYTIGNYLNDLTLVGSSNINGTGNELNNIITGNNATNILNGGGGNDTLIGGAGTDTLTGGAGADNFRFHSSTQGSDTVSDFTQTQADKIQVSASGFGGGLTVGNLSSTQFYIGTTAHDSSDLFIYNSASRQLFFDVDGIGGLGQKQIASFLTSVSLTSSDISIIW